MLGRAQRRGQGDRRASRRSSFRSASSTRCRAAQQQAMLEQTLARARRSRDRVLGEMVAAWRDGELESLSAELLDEFDEFPGLYETLVTKRNSAWVPTLERMLARRAPPSRRRRRAAPRRPRQRHRSAARTRARRRAAAVAAMRLSRSHLDHLEVFLAGAAIGAAPRERNVGPLRARRESLRRAGLRLRRR